MATDAHEWLNEWHAAVPGRDKGGITALLAEDVSIGAPPYWTPLEGKPIVGRLLGVIVDTIEDFTYHREWSNGNELALEFTGRVGDLSLQGIDLITLNDDGLIQHLDVLIRPANALMELMRVVGEQMQAVLAELNPQEHAQQPQQTRTYPGCVGRSSRSHAGICKEQPLQMNGIDRVGATLRGCPGPRQARRLGHVRGPAPT